MPNNNYILAKKFKIETPVKVSVTNIDNEQYLYLDMNNGEYTINQPFTLEDINYIKYDGKKYFILCLAMVVQFVKQNSHFRSSRKDLHDT